MVNSKFILNIKDFSGPLDLLLFMIKNKEIDIFDLNLLEIINQYVEYIESISDNIDLASDYITMAAHLLEIKSSLLLPQSTLEIEEITPEEEREELVKQLLEYKKIKDVAVQFKKIQDNEYGRLSKHKSLLVKDTAKQNNLDIENVSIDKLSKVFLRLIEKFKYQRPTETKLVRQNISTEEISNKIIELLEKKVNKQINILELLEYFDYNLKVFAACFISVLDLCLYQKIKILQHDNYNEIIIEYTNVPKGGITKDGD